MTLRVGAHASVAGGVHNAVDEQQEVGGNCGQIFSHSPQVWQDPDVEPDNAAQFREASKAGNIGPWVIHASYLVNLATPKPDLREKSIASMQREVDVADTLGVRYVNVHLGAHTGAGVESGLENAATTLDELAVPDGVTKRGGDFEHLRAVLDRSEQDLEVCLDTAHAFAAGYDLSTTAAVEETIAEFDDVVGLENLACVHLNDSKHGCGTNKDEHAHIGEGLVGEEGMRAFVNHEAVREVPLVLETPTEDGKDFHWNIQRVRELRS